LVFFIPIPFIPFPAQNRIKPNAILAGKGSLRERGLLPLSRLSPSQTT
jgi:hypothetical protein